jgi:hypothetical protein
MPVTEGFDNQSAGGVEPIGIRTATAGVGVGRACDDGTEARVFDVHVPRPLSAAERRTGDDHRATSTWCRVGGHHRFPSGGK